MPTNDPSTSHDEEPPLPGTEPASSSVFPSPLPPERREITAHGSHQRLVKKRAGPAVAKRTAPLPVRWTAPMIAWRVALAVVVLVAFAGLMSIETASVLAQDTLPLTAILLAMGSLTGCYFAATVFYALRYRAPAPLSDAALPKITVIVPAYNEGAAVRVALESALASDYPKDKLTILAVDDGSKDDTWKHMEAVAQANPTQILAFQQPENRGKREALREGFLQADGDFVVTVDSDSKLEPGALRAIVAPMVADPEVAAVAGRVLVLNRTANFFTRILAARFFITFDLARAAQSRFGAVLCTPGALSAYRLSAVREVLEPWSSQTFFGQPCTIAEDRALTTWLLRAGYRSVYQRDAVVETLMPRDLPRIFRMLIRWERGNIREDLVMLPVLFTKWRPRDRFWPTLEIALELIQPPLGWLALGCALRWVVDLEAALTLIGIVALGAAVQTLYTLRSPRATDYFFGVAYGLLALIGLQWVFPYSLVTVRDGRWLTR